MTTYTIEQQTEYQWEPIPEGEFEALADAIAAVNTLQSDLGWTGMRIVDHEHAVVYIGTPHAASDQE